MKSRSIKRKGWVLEKYLQDWFRKELDSDTHRNAGSGSGLNKGDVRIPSHNILIEAKNQKVLAVMNWWEQAQQDSLGDDIPVLAFNNPRKKQLEEILIVTSLEHFTDLLRTQNETINVNPKLSWQSKSKLNTLKSAISGVLNDPDLKQLFN